MDQRTLQPQLDAVADVDRPDDLEVATLTTYDIPALAALHLVAYDRPEIAENLWEATDEMRGLCRAVARDLHEVRLFLLRSHGVVAD